MKHARRIVILVGACASFASNKLYQEELLKTINEEEYSIEIQIDKLNQQDFSGKACDAYAAINKDV